MKEFLKSANISQSYEPISSGTFLWPTMHIFVLYRNSQINMIKFDKWNKCCMSTKQDSNKQCQAQQISPRARCKVLPPGEFSSIIPEPLYLYFESFIVIAKTVLCHRHCRLVGGIIFSKCPSVRLFVCSSVRPFVWSLPVLWIRYSENEWTFLVQIGVSCLWAMRWNGQLGGQESRCTQPLKSDLETWRRHHFRPIRSSSGVGFLVPVCC